MSGLNSPRSTYIDPDVDKRQRTSHTQWRVEVQSIQRHISSKRARGIIIIRLIYIREFEIK